MTRVSRKTKRRTGRKSRRSIKRSIKRYLEKPLRKKSLNKFNKRIKKYKKKKTKKKIQRGGSAGAGAGRSTGQGPGAGRFGTGGLTDVDAEPGSGALLNKALANIMKFHSTQMAQQKINCVNLPDDLRGYIETTPAMVISELRKQYRGEDDQTTIINYLNYII